MRGTTTGTRGRFLKALGPGILFAGAAIGVSHLVQSTRAGAQFGLGLLPVVLLAHLGKYPGLSFGCRYAAATGTSLLEGYRRQGVYALIVFAIITLGTMFTIAAAITLVTAAAFRAGVLEPIFDAMGWTLRMPFIASASTMLLACVVLLATGGYRWLDRVMKVLMVVMLLLTLGAAAVSLPDLELTRANLFPAGVYTASSVAFIVALVGWMPAPLDIAVWNSLWTLARAGSTKHDPSKGEARADFLVGMSLTVVIACAFVLLGTVLMHQRGVTPPEGAGAFVERVIALYTESIGNWVRPVIGVCAFAVMFSTLLTVIDAMPRVLVVLQDRFRSAETPGEETRDAARRVPYWVWMTLIVAGALILVSLLSGSLKTLVDLATTLSFLTTPVLALFNHRAMHGTEVPAEHRPSKFTTAASWVGIVVLTGFAVVYLWLSVPGWLGMGG